MKFFIFTCLLAVALAKHKMEQSSSSEESVNISQKKLKQEKNVAIHPSKEIARNINKMEHSSSSSSEESAEDPTENKINQPQIVTNPWEQIQSRAYPFFPAVNRKQVFTREKSASFSQEETPKTDTESTEVLTQKTKLTKEEINYLKLLNKITQYYQKFPLPQYFKTVNQFQTTVKPRNHFRKNAYQIIPILRYF